jgi:hypothetical protein
MPLFQIGLIVAIKLLTGENETARGDSAGLRLDSPMTQSPLEMPIGNSKGLKRLTLKLSF